MIGMPFTMNPSAWHCQFGRRTEVLRETEPPFAGNATPRRASLDQDAAYGRYPGIAINQIPKFDPIPMQELRTRV
jgi:hypothetical protein